MSAGLVQESSPIRKRDSGCGPGSGDGCCSCCSGDDGGAGLSVSTKPRRNDAASSLGMLPIVEPKERMHLDRLRIAGVCSQWRASSKVPRRPWQWM